MSLFTTSSPLASIEPVKVARSLLATRFSTPSRNQGLWVWKGNVLEWFGGQWVVRDREWMEGAVWLALEDAHFSVQTSTGTEIRRFAPSPTKVEGVMKALWTVARLPYEKLPSWVGVPPLDPSRCVTFRDRVVDAKTMQSIPRDERWIEPTVLPVECDPEAECPTWDRCLEQWSAGEPEWKTLVKRMFGYCLMGHALYAKWFLLHGKVRGGKGTMTTVLRELLGKAYMGSSLEDLARPFGLWGLEKARVLSIGEVSEVKGGEAETACRILKQIVGRDPLIIDIKYQAPLSDVVSDAVPLMQANEIPRLPNKGMGLSSKMVPIPFRVSFLGREDHLLMEKLRAELPGIAAWALEGAHELENESEPSKRFPLTTDGAELLDDYATANNPVDEFLEEHFDRSPNGFLASSVLHARWEEWARQSGARRMGIKSLIQHLREHSSWGLEKHRLGDGGPRGLRGLKLRPRA